LTLFPRKTMRLLILSDLHLEVWRERAPLFDILASMPDMVILAGDIHTGARAPAWAAETFPALPVVYVAGNHEFYGAAIEAGEAIRDECEGFPNMHYLDCDEYVQGGVRFLGSTLWTDFGLFNPARTRSAMLDARARMADYQRIRVASTGYRKLHPQDTARLHASQRGWLEKKLAEPFDGQTVVVTHMAPSMRSVAAKYASDPVSPAFASRLDHLVEQADLWVHGHTHTSFDYRISRCRVVANPLGYPMRDGSAENMDFSPNFIVQLGA
jgi:predicted phosphodiesterase